MLSYVDSTLTDEGNWHNKNSKRFLIFRHGCPIPSKRDRRLDCRLLWQSEFVRCRIWANRPNLFRKFFWIFIFGIIKILFLSSSEKFLSMSKNNARKFQSYTKFIVAQTNSSLTGVFEFFTVYDPYILAGIFACFFLVTLIYLIILCVSSKLLVSESASVGTVSFFIRRWYFYVVFSLLGSWFACSWRRLIRSGKNCFQVSFLQFEK
jgi:hypothetical protein